jgi:DNA-binding NtrC family response regulator
MPRSVVVLITSDPPLIEAVRGVIDPIGNLQLTAVATVDEACSLLPQSEVALMVAHLARGTDAPWVGLLIKTVAATQRPLATLVVSDLHQPEQALALMRLGVADCLDRPLDLGRLAYLIDVLTLRARYTLRPTASPCLPQQRVAAGMVPAPSREAVVPRAFFYQPGSAMGRLMEQVRRVAPQDTTVLLNGETGTGKTRLARLIHDLSPRLRDPFLVVNCGTLSASLIESELFGHARGAFTGADRDRVGKFAEAGRGTLLLDEVDALPLVLQAKLLRAVEERLFEPVGMNKSLPVQARLLAATNRVLDQEIAANRFRSDLYYRLNVVALYLPPLRERPGEIATLAAQFAGEFAARNGRPVPGLSADALQALEQYSWPGNIRELRNVVERAVILCPGPEIALDDLPDTVSSAYKQSGPLAGGVHPSGPGTLARTKEEAEALRITDALRKHRNNRQRAAAELGISRMTLYKKLHRYGLIGVQRQRPRSALPLWKKGHPGLGPGTPPG